MLKNLAQTYDYTLSDTSGGFTISPLFWVLILAFAVLMIASMWRVFTKAGKPGWAAIVPIYNTVVTLEIVGRPLWWILLILAGAIPIIGPVIAFVVGVILSNDLSKSFGKGIGMTVMLILLPFIGFPMLAWGNATYQGAAAKEGGTTPPAMPPTPPTTPSDTTTTTTPPATPPTTPPSAPTPPASPTPPTTPSV